MGSKLVFGFIISNGVGRYFKIVAFDKPELFDAFATINKVQSFNGSPIHSNFIKFNVFFQVVTIKAAKATCQNIYTDANNLNLSAFEFQVCDAAQVRFYVTLRRSELVLMPNYRLDIEDEEDD